MMSALPCRSGGQYPQRDCAFPTVSAIKAPRVPRGFSPQSRVPRGLLLNLGIELRSEQDHDLRKAPKAPVAGRHLALCTR